jgi:hypothetical protein
MAESGQQGRKPLHRLSAEMVVIAVGVFLGLGADAAWDARQEGLRELDYLRQLHGDLRATERDLEQASIAQERVRRSSDLAIAGINARVLPAPDSLARWTWRSTFMAGFEPTLGTVTTLVTTGDLRLIQNEGLRREVLAYEQMARRFEASGGSYNEHRLRALEQLGHAMSLDALPAPYGSEHPRIPTNWDALASDPLFHSSVFNLALVSKVRTDLLAAFELRAGDLRMALEREMSARGVEPTAFRAAPGAYQRQAQSPL